MATPEHPEPRRSWVCVSQPGCEGGREHRWAPAGKQRQNLQQISLRELLSIPTGCSGQHSISASSQENPTGITGLKGSIFLSHSGPTATPKRFVLGCRQRAGAFSGALLIPQGAESGVTTPCLAWKVSKSLISLFCPHRACAASFPMTFGIAHNCCDLPWVLLSEVASRPPFFRVSSLLNLSKVTPS